MPEYAKTYVYTARRERERERGGQDVRLSGPLGWAGLGWACGGGPGSLDRARRIGRRRGIAVARARTGAASLHTEQQERRMGYCKCPAQASWISCYYLSYLISLSPLPSPPPSHSPHLSLPALCIKAQQQQQQHNTTQLQPNSYSTLPTLSIPPPSSLSPNIPNTIHLPSSPPSSQNFNSR